MAVWGGSRLHVCIHAWWWFLLMHFLVLDRFCVCVLDLDSIVIIFDHHRISRGYLAKPEKKEKRASSPPLSNSSHKDIAGTRCLLNVARIPFAYIYWAVIESSLSSSSSSWCLGGRTHDRHCDRANCTLKHTSSISIAREMLKLCHTPPPHTSVYR